MADHYCISCNTHWPTWEAHDFNKPACVGGKDYQVEAKAGSTKAEEKDGFCTRCGNHWYSTAHRDNCRPVAEEIRTVSKTGGQKGVKPQRYALLPRDALDCISEIYHFGESKYSAHNWRKGYEWSKSYDALQRHLTAWWECDETDTESGLSHLASAGFHLFALITFSRNDRYAEYDDRYRKDE